jgi:hypothetical protein
MPLSYGFGIPKMLPPASNEDVEKRCNELRSALKKAGMEDGMAEIVSAHTKLILQYYEDVKRHACVSFDSANTVAFIGFAVLIVTLIFTIVIDVTPQHSAQLPSQPQSLLTVPILGAVSGVLIEFIAGVTFFLYARVARQFNAFHICLERTHRYLLAYAITNDVKENKDQGLADLVKVMANAPMIQLELGPSAVGRHHLTGRET